MKLDFQTRQAILKLKNSLTIIEKVKQKSIRIQAPEELIFNLDIMMGYITSALHEFKNRQLLSEEDFCWIDSVVQETQDS